MKPEVRAGGAVRIGGGTAVRPDEAVEDLAAGVGDHEPRRDARGHERPDHRAGRGADDLVRAARVPLGLLRERAQPADEPRAAKHATRAEHQPHLH
jgi:hypothetical protein